MTAVPMCASVTPKQARVVFPDALREPRRGTGRARAALVCLGPAPTRSETAACVQAALLDAAPTVGPASAMPGITRSLPLHALEIGIVISSQSGHRLPALTPDQDKPLATTPVEELLSLPMLQPDQVTDPLHAYQVSKRTNVLRVMAEAVTWGKRGARVNARVLRRPRA
jgi:hypothetical protein